MYEKYTREAVIVSICQFVIHEHRRCTVLILQLFYQLARLVLWDLEAWPAIPLKLSGFGETTEAGDEAARRHVERVGAIIRSLDCNRETIGDEEQPP
jgi:hypothetical protein